MRGDWTNESVTASEVVGRMKSGDRVFVHGAAATPTALLDAMCARADLERVTLYHLHTEGHVAFADSAYQGRFRSVSLFVGPALRGQAARAARTSSRSSFPRSRTYSCPDRSRSMSRAPAKQVRAATSKTRGRSFPETDAEACS